MPHHGKSSKNEKQVYDILGMGRDCPFIVGLEEIVRDFLASEFSELFAKLSQYFWIADRWPAEREIDGGVVSQLQLLVEDGTALTRKLELRNSHERIVKYLRLEVIGAYGPPRWGRLKDQIGTLLETLQFEISGRRFAAITENKSDFLGGVLGKDGKSPDQKWLKIWASFPSLREECEEAVYCYVLERNTACVFHSMRIAEIGLRALARHLKVRLSKGKKLEWAEWQILLREISKKIEGIGQTAKPGPAKDSLLDFCSGAMGQFMGFKDEFRNQVMHVRRSYDEYEAGSALTRVRDFMAKLASKIDEKGKKVPA